MINNNIGEYRRECQVGGISKAHLARQVGVTRSYMVKIEKGLQYPSLDLAFKLAKFFECDIEDLFSRT